MESEIRLGKSFADFAPLPVPPERLETFLKKALALLGPRKGDDPVLALRLNAIPQDFYHASLAWQQETTARSDKDAARTIAKKAKVLEQALHKAPKRLRLNLGLILSAIKLGPGAQLEVGRPDPKWEIRQPRMLDTICDLLGAVAQLSDQFGRSSLPRPARSPDRVLVECCIQLAADLGRPKRVGLELAKLAYEAATNRPPKPAAWGAFYAKRFKPIKG